jgi:uncharacterized protein (UPF0128 family)
MKFYLITRNDDVDYEQYDAAVVMAETPEAAIELIKNAHKDDSPYLKFWGDYDVSATEIIQTEPKIILESFRGG